MWTFVDTDHLYSPSEVQRDLIQRESEVEWHSLTKFGSRLWGRRETGEQRSVVLAEIQRRPDRYSYTLIEEGEQLLNSGMGYRIDCPLELVDDRTEDVDPKWAERVRQYHRRVAYAKSLELGDAIAVNPDFGGGYGVLISKRPLRAVMFSRHEFGQVAKLSWEMIATMAEVQDWAQRGRLAVIHFMQRLSLLDLSKATIARLAARRQFAELGLRERRAA